jgi:molybdate transport system ATP-binding protein
MQPLVRLEGVDVALGGKTILRGINWELLPGEHWAIVGRNGSGKSTFLKLVRGELWPAPNRGKRTYFFDGREQSRSAAGVKERISVVSPELQERYLQQEWRLAAGDVVLSGLANTEYLYIKPTRADREHADALAEVLGITKLLHRNVQQLSTGELRKVLIARALAGCPAVLILDEVCDGLDVGSRQALLGAIDCVAQRGTQILYATHRLEELIPSVKNVLEIENGQIARRARVNQPPMADRDGKKTLREGHSSGKVLIDIRDADVYLERKRVLHQINWRLRENEHWAVVGANGAGKSTFLKLIIGDIHPAAGGTVQRWNFDPTNTLWDIRCRIGFLSPELQANYRDSMSAADVVASGFFSSIGLTREPTPEQQRRVRDLMKAFAAIHLANKHVGEMSYGEFRKILLLRALVHNPEILVCDEPFDGLDAESRANFREALEQATREGTQLIVVTHHVNELPDCMTHTLVVENGRVVSC